MLVEGRGDAAPPPCVTLTFPLSDPHFPFRCARIDIVKSADGHLRVTAHQESDRRLPAPNPGVAIGSAEGSRVLSDASVERLFAPSQSPAVASRRTSARWWIGLHDIDVGLQRRTSECALSDSTVSAYVVPNFLTRALAHLATRNLRLHVVANAAAVGHGGKPSSASLWRSVAFDPATLYVRAVQRQEDHTFYLRAPLHKTFCRCLCGAYAPLTRGGHANADGCQPCLDIYMCGRQLVGGRCPTHAEWTRTGAHGVCVARTSLRMKCVHGTDNAPPTASAQYSTYNSLDHELLLAPAEKQIVRDIAASAVHLRKCAVALAVALAPPPREEGAGVPATLSYLRAERSRLDGVLSGLYQSNGHGERTDTAGKPMHGVEWWECHAQQADTPSLQTLDDRATQLLCEGEVTVEIGDSWEATAGSFPNTGKLRVQPQVVRLQGVAKLWRRPKQPGGTRTRINVMIKRHDVGKEIEYIYGRLFEHRNAPSPHPRKAQKRP
jgi:hypothetical protein